MIRRGISLGRPLVPKLGQMFQWPGGGVPQFAPLSAQQAGVPFSSYSHSTTSPSVPPLWNRKCVEAWVREHPEYSSYLWNSPDLVKIMQEIDFLSFSVCSRRHPAYNPEYPDYMRDGPIMEGLGLGKGAGLGSHNKLGATGPLATILESDYVDPLLDLGVAVTGFISGATLVRGWWALIPYGLGILGLMRFTSRVSKGDPGATVVSGMLGALAAFGVYNSTRDIKCKGATT